MADDPRVGKTIDLLVRSPAGNFMTHGIVRAVTNKGKTLRVAIVGSGIMVSIPTSSVTATR